MKRITNPKVAVSVLNDFLRKIELLERGVCLGPWTVESRTDKEYLTDKDYLKETTYSIEGVAGAYGQDRGPLGNIWGDNMIWSIGGQGENVKFMAASRFLIPAFKDTIKKLLDEHKINQSTTQSKHILNVSLVGIANIVKDFQIPAIKNFKPILVQNK